MWRPKPEIFYLWNYDSQNGNSDEEFGICGDEESVQVIVTTTDHHKWQYSRQNGNTLISGNMTGSKFQLQTWDILPWRAR